MTSKCFGSVAGHWLFSRRRWLNPGDDDDRRALEEGYHRLCSMLPTFKACQLSIFLQVLARTTESWAKRASECWANQKIVVLFPRPGEAQILADRVFDLEALVSAPRSREAVSEDFCSSNQGQPPPACDVCRRHSHSAEACPAVQAREAAVGSAIDCGSGDLCDAARVEDEQAFHRTDSEEALHRRPRRDWLSSDSDCDDSDSDDRSVDMHGNGGRGNAATSSSDWMAVAEAGPDDAVALQLLEYTRSTAAAVADAQQPEGTAGDMDAVLESLPWWSADADELEKWACTTL
jgi:hypothetical protein